jgi:hypothetical protein
MLQIVITFNLISILYIVYQSSFIVEELWLG